MSDATLPQAGWYADPEDPSRERWWNGSGWSDHKRPSTVAAAPTTPPAVARAPSVAAVPSIPPAPAVVPAATGVDFGAPDPTGPRPDPYARPAYSPYTPSPYSPAPYGAVAAPSGTNPLALAGLIVSIVGVFFGIAALVGIVLSILGLAEARKREAAGTPNPGRGLAIAGIVVGSVVAFFGLVVIVIYFVFLLNVGYPS
jgi:hypothetical protein